MRAAWIVLAACVACGEPGPSPPPPPVASLFPVKVGNSWTFRVSDASSTETTKVQSVTGTAASAGGAAFRFLTINGNQRTESVQRLEGSKLLREEETVLLAGAFQERVRYTPASLRLDTEQSTLGATYQESFAEEHLDQSGRLLSSTPKAQTFTVEAVDESVTVPAGSFTCVRIRRVTEGGTAKTFWYARGVGKVKEVGGQTEQLSAFSLAE